MFESPFGTVARPATRGIAHRFVVIAGRVLERAYAIAVRMSFVHLSCAIIFTALVVAIALSIFFWDALYGVTGLPIVVTTTIVALLTASPLTAFVVYVIKKAESARGQLQESNVALAAERAKQMALVEALRGARDEADAANRAKTQFIANMSHELRTPLNAIIGFSEMLKTETFGPVGNLKYREYGVDIYNSGSHLLDLINDILDVARIEAGGFALHEENLDVGATARAALRLVQMRAAEQGVTLANLVPAGLPHLYGDARSLKQMFLNLLSNAVRFTPAGGRVVVSAMLGEGGALVISVQDTGIGMAKPDIPKAMMRFSQVDNSHSRKYQGAGLGLSLTKSLAELHGGALALESELGAGTVARLRFPATRLRPR